MEKSSSHPAVALRPCRYPNTACELLTCDVPQISDRLGGDETLLNVLYNFLDREPPLNPLLASFFSKTIGNLIARKTEQVIIRPACVLWEGGSANANHAVSRCVEGSSYCSEGHTWSRMAAAVGAGVDEEAVFPREGRGPALDERHSHCPGGHRAPGEAGLPSR